MTKQNDLQFVKIKSINIFNDLAEIELIYKEGFFNPGQFYILGVPGWGEAPFTPTNLSSNQSISFLIRRAGTLTKKIFKLSKNDLITLRGPYGNPFPLKYMQGKNITLIAGGCGLAPIKGLLEYLLAHKSEFGNIQLFYGVNTPSEISYKNFIKSLKKKIELILTVAKPDKKYHGNTGFIDKYITKNTILKNSIAILCGPSPMYQPVVNKLISAGITVDDIYLQLERKMHCGVGLCQHCTCGTKYVCKDGPAFSYREILKMDKLSDL